MAKIRHLDRLLYVLLNIDKCGPRIRRKLTTHLAITITHQYHILHVSCTYIYIYIYLYIYIYICVCINHTDDIHHNYSQMYCTSLISHISSGKRLHSYGKSTISTGPCSSSQTASQSQSVQSMIRHIYIYIHTYYTTYIITHHYATHTMLQYTYIYNKYIYIYI